MTRDNVLFGLIGLLAGFIAGYLVHEVMAVRQPPRLPAGSPGVVAEQAGSSGQPAPRTPAGGPSMEEIERLRQYVAENPDDPDGVLALANVNYDIQNWERSRDLYLRYLELAGPDPDVLTDLGVTLRELGSYQDALARFDQAQELSDEHWQSLYNEVVVLAFDLEDYDAATRVLERLQALQPDNGNVERLAEEVRRRRDAAA